MSLPRQAIGVAAGLLGVAAAGVTARAVTQRSLRLEEAREAGNPNLEPIEEFFDPEESDHSAQGDIDFTSLRSPSWHVITDDGIDLHAEVDEADSEITVVLVHGFTLDLDCWHFQREALRGKYRTVVYDQRSHGRSARSVAENCTIDQLARDLAQVLETTTDGPVVLLGHSMGGMTVISLAAHRPDLFGEKIIGVGLVATTAGGLDPGRILFPLMPFGVMGTSAVGRSLKVLKRGPVAVDRLRRAVSKWAKMIIDRYAFGDDVPASWAKFVFDSIDATPFEVVAAFYPTFVALDHFDELAALENVPVTIIGGTGDRITGIGHQRKLHEHLPHAVLHEERGAGHMVMMERHGDVNAQMFDLLQRADSATAASKRENGSA